MNLEIEIADDADDARIEITADRNKLFSLRNAVFSAYYDARFPTDEGDRLRNLIPSPSETLQSATFRLSADEASALADALQEAADYADDDGRAATGRRIEGDVSALRFAKAADA